MRAGPLSSCPSFSSMYMMRVLVPAMFPLRIGKFFVAEAPTPGQPSPSVQSRPLLSLRIEDTPGEQHGVRLPVSDKEQEWMVGLENLRFFRQHGGASRHEY